MDTYMEIDVNICKYMEIYVNIWRYMEICGNMLNIYGNMEIYVYIYICMEMYVNIWKYMDNVSFLDRKMERWWWIHLNFLLSTRTYV